MGVRKKGASAEGNQKRRLSVKGSEGWKMWQVAVCGGLATMPATCLKQVENIAFHVGKHA